MTSVLTEQQLTDLVNKCDINGDGHLNKAELEIAFQHLAATFPRWRAYWALHHADADSNGSISKEEMRGLVQYVAKFKYTRNIPPQLAKQLDVLEINRRLNEIFKRYDADGDGYLDKQELRTAFHHLGAFNPRWRAYRALRHADVNEDGFIDENEMDALVLYAAKKYYTLK